MQKIKLIGLLVFFLLAGVFTAKLFFIENNSEIEVARLIPDTDTLPAITVFNLASEATNLSKDLSLTATNVIFIYSLGCNSCISEARIWAEMYASKRDTFNFLGLVYSSDSEAVESFVRSTGLDFEHRLIDQFNANKIQINDWPTILGVDGNNNMLFKFEGTASTDSLVSYLSD